MKVLLRENVDKVGARGTIVDVAEGFARNYLIPRKLAVVATEANFRQLEAERGRIARQAARERAALEEKRRAIEAVSCTIVVAASPEGHLYGSVGQREIAEALAGEGFQLAPDQVRLEQPFKETGVYPVQVEVGTGITATTRVWVMALEEAAKPA